MKCTCGTSVTGERRSYLGEPLCYDCAMAERDDGTDEAKAEAWARDNDLPHGAHTVEIDDQVFLVLPGDGRDWTAVAELEVTE